MAVSRWAVPIAVLLGYGSVAQAGYCYNYDGACNTACPAAWSCWSDDQCAPGGYCDLSLCLSHYCNCEPLTGSQWYWSCSLICVGICEGPTPPDSDTDGMPDYFDNCPLIANAGQLNADHDRDGDACDCAPNNSTLHSPPELQNVKAERVPSGTRFYWPATPNATRYEIKRELLGVQGPGQCRTGADPNPSDTEFVDVDVPIPGVGWWYLFRGATTSCGGAPWAPTVFSPDCP